MTKLAPHDLDSGLSAQPGFATPRLSSVTSIRNQRESWPMLSGVGQELQSRVTVARQD